MSLFRRAGGLLILPLFLVMGALQGMGEAACAWYADWWQRR